jgi:hypothetical protein
LQEIPEVIARGVSSIHSQNGGPNGRDAIFYVVCGDSQLQLCNVYLGTSFVTILREEIRFLSYPEKGVCAEARVPEGRGR